MNTKQQTTEPSRECLQESTTLRDTLEMAKVAMMDVAHGSPVFGESVRRAIKAIDAALQAAPPAPAAVAVPSLANRVRPGVEAAPWVCAAIAKQDAELACLRAALAAPEQAVPHCATCNDHGAVGNILTAEPCTDCTPQEHATQLAAQAQAMLTHEKASRQAAQQQLEASKADLAKLEMYRFMLAHRGRGDDANTAQTRMDAGSGRGYGLPTGWQAVPVEPTHQMQSAALKYVVRQHQTRDVWRTMLAAAPQTPAAQVLAMGHVPVDLEAVWDAFTEAVRVKIGAKELVNIIGSVKALRPIFLASAPRTPAMQERKPLTDEQIDAIQDKHMHIYPATPRRFARMIEAAHGIKDSA